MKYVVIVLAAFRLVPAASAEEVKVQYRVSGLFQPDREDDLRRLAGSPTIRDGDASTPTRLVEVDYETALVTFAYDPESKPFQGKTPEQVRDLFEGFVRNASRGTFILHPPSPLKPGELRQVRIAVAGLDCKGCAFGAYRAVDQIDGVVRAVVDFEEGHVTATIDPTKTSREALIAGLEKAEVDVTEPPPDAGK